MPSVLTPLTWHMVKVRSDLNKVQVKLHRVID